MNRVQNELDTEKQLLQVLQNKTKQAEERTIQSTMELQKEVPVKPLVEQFLLDLDKAEIISNSFISNLSVSEDEVSESAELLQSTEPIETDKVISTEEGNEAEVAVEFPEGLKKITVNLTVQSPSYYELEEFLTTVENLIRITKVESLSLTGPEEVTSIELDLQPLTYTVSVSIFYHPGLQDLVDQLPPLEIPDRGNKRNPLYYFNIE